MEVNVTFVEQEGKGDLVRAFAVEEATVSWMISFPDSSSLTLLPGEYEIRKVG